SRVLKPYHGVRILENDGKNNFHERYFLPIHGAARAEVADFDRDGDLDILVTSNFADVTKHPERGIIYLENTGRYQFQPYSFSVATAPPSAGVRSARPAAKLRCEVCPGDFSKNCSDAPRVTR